MSNMSFYLSRFLIILVLSTTITFLTLQNAWASENVNMTATDSTNKNATISMKLGLEPGLEVDKLQVASEEMSSSNVKICPTDNCQFGFLGKIGDEGEVIQPGLKQNSDANAYLFEGLLKVTVNNAEGISTGSSSYDVEMNLNPVESEVGDETTENLSGTMTLLDENNPELKTEYDVHGTLVTEPGIEHEELEGFIEVGPINLNLMAVEK